MEPENLFPEIKILQANPNTRSRRRRFRKKAKIRSLKTGCKGDDAVKMGPSSLEQFDVPPPDSVAAEVTLQQVEDDVAVMMMLCSSKQLSDAPPPPIMDVTSSYLNSDRGTILQLGKRRILASLELIRSSYYLRSHQDHGL